jgi:UDP-glucose 4-epimerase
MDIHLDSEDSSPCFSQSSSGSGFDTPLTGRSTLFEDAQEDLDLSSQDFILVVGGLGYIGSHTCLELLKAGHNVLIIDNLSNSYRRVYSRIQTLSKHYYEARCEKMPHLRLYEADYRDQTAISEILGEFVVSHISSAKTNADQQISSRIQGVVHFAAYKSVSESIQQPLKYYANNLSGLIEFCSTLNNFNIKTFIFSSSATIYGSLSNSGKPLMEEYCTHETESFIDHDRGVKTVLGGCSGLTNPYGRTKWMCEAILSDLALADPEWTIVALRYFNPVGCDESGLLGEDPRGIPTNLMPVVLRVLTGLSPILDVFGTDWPTPDGTAVRDFIHVTDLALGHIAALAAAADNRLPKGFRTYNLGSGIGYSVLDVVGAVESVSSSTIPLRKVGRRDGDVGSCVAMPKRAEIELNWKAERTLETSCKDICNYLEKMTIDETLDI